MRRAHLAFAVVAGTATALAAPLAAQEDDRDYLTAFLEDNLSGAGRKVTITGSEIRSLDDSVTVKSSYTLGARVGCEDILVETLAVKPGKLVRPLKELMGDWWRQGVELMLKNRGKALD